MVFIVQFRMKGQQRQLELMATNRVNIKSGIPHTLQLVNANALLKLEPGKTVAR